MSERAMTDEERIAEWSARPLFAVRRGDGAGTVSEVVQHLPSHWVECPKCGCSFQDRAHSREIGDG